MRRGRSSARASSSSQGDRTIDEFFKQPRPPLHGAAADAGTDDEEPPVEPVGPEGVPQLDEEDPVPDPPQPAPAVGVPLVEEIWENWREWVPPPTQLFITSGGTAEQAPDEAEARDGDNEGSDEDVKDISSEGNADSSGPASSATPPAEKKSKKSLGFDPTNTVRYLWVIVLKARDCPGCPADAPKGVKRNVVGLLCRVCRSTMQEKPDARNAFARTGGAFVKKFQFQNFRSNFSKFSEKLFHHEFGKSTKKTGANFPRAGKNHGKKRLRQMYVGGAATFVKTTHMEFYLSALERENCIR